MSNTTIPNSLFKFDPLTPDNWLAWKRRVSAMMREKKLLSLIEGSDQTLNKRPVQAGTTATSEELTKMAVWDEMDGQARTIIELSIGDKEMIHISGANTAKEMWDQLKLVKESRGRIGILAARRKLYRSYAEEGTDIADHVTEFRKMQEEIHMMGSLVADEDFCMLLLSSLPESWDQFTSAYLGSHSDEKVMVKLHELIAILLEENRRRRERGNTEIAMYSNPNKG